MKPKLIVTILLVAFLLASAAYFAADEARRRKASPDAASVDSAAAFSAAPAAASPDSGLGTPAPRTAALDSAAAAAGNAVVVYYFHGTRRCATCRRIEQYTSEAIMNGFGAEIRKKTLLWRVVNVDEAGNGHFIEDYGLSTKSVVLARVVDGKGADWKNLSRIWELTGDRSAFIAYIQDEVRRFEEGKS